MYVASTALPQDLNEEWEFCSGVFFGPTRVLLDYIINIDVGLASCLGRRGALDHRETEKVNSIARMYIQIFYSVPSTK